MVRDPWKIAALTLGAVLFWQVQQCQRANARASQWPADADLDEELKQLAVMAVGSADAVCQRGKFLLNDR